jgi:phosphohistidine phosphatase
LKTLFLLRHAEAVGPGAGDLQRKLTLRGRASSLCAGKTLARNDLCPQRVLCSTASRTRETLQNLMESCEKSIQVEYSTSLYEGDAAVYLDMLQSSAITEDRVLIVGHNPTIADMVFMLTRKLERFSPCTLARIDLPIEDWDELRENTAGSLQALWPH